MKVQSTKQLEARLARAKEREAKCKEQLAAAKAERVRATEELKAAKKPTAQPATV